LSSRGEEEDDADGKEEDGKEEGGARNRHEIRWLQAKVGYIFSYSILILITLGSLLCVLNMSK